MKGPSRRPDFIQRRHEARTWNAEEINSRIQSIPNLKYRTILALVFLTDSRISEICLLKYSDVYRWVFNGEDGLVFNIKVEKRKDNFIKQIPILRSKEQEFLPLLNLVDRWLRSHKPLSDGYLFGNPEIVIRKRYKSADGYWRKGNIDNKLRKKVYNLMIKKGLNPHQFRHARSSYLVRYRNIGIFLLKAMGGWKKIQQPLSYIEDLGVEELARIV